MPRWLALAGFGLLGIALGVFYGWLVNPVKFLDTTPASLRVDYRLDFVLMTAESFHANHDSDAARREMAILGGQSPASICAEVIRIAETTPYSKGDLALIQELARAMQALPAAPSASGGKP